jgi:hypothetical protein
MTILTRAALGIVCGVVSFGAFAGVAAAAQPTTPTVSATVSVQVPLPLGTDGGIFPPKVLP